MERATTGSLSAVQVQASTQAGTPASWPSAPSAIESGPAGHGSECAHEMTCDYVKVRTGQGYFCEKCGALMEFVAIAARDVAPAISTSVTQDSGISAGTEQGGVESSSNVSSDWQEGVYEARRPLPPSDEDQLP